MKRWIDLTTRLFRTRIDVARIVQQHTERSLLQIFDSRTSASRCALQIQFENLCLQDGERICLRPPLDPLQISTVCKYVVEMYLKIFFNQRVACG